MSKNLIKQSDIDRFIDRVRIDFYGNLENPGLNGWEPFLDQIAHFWLKYELESDELISVFKITNVPSYLKDIKLLNPVSLLIHAQYLLFFARKKRQPINQILDEYSGIIDSEYKENKEQIIQDLVRIAEVPESHFPMIFARSFQSTNDFYTDLNEALYNNIQDTNVHESVLRLLNLEEIQIPFEKYPEKFSALLQKRIKDSAQHLYYDNSEDVREGARRKQLQEKIPELSGDKIPEFSGNDVEDVKLVLDLLAKEHERVDPNASEQENISFLLSRMFMKRVPWDRAIKNPNQMVSPDYHEAPGVSTLQLLNAPWIERLKELVKDNSSLEKQLDDYPKSIGKVVLLCLIGNRRSMMKGWDILVQLDDRDVEAECLQKWDQISIRTLLKSLRQKPKLIYSICKSGNKIFSEYLSEASSMVYQIISEKKDIDWNHLAEFLLEMSVQKKKENNQYLLPLLEIIIKEHWRSEWKFKFPHYQTMAALLKANDESLRSISSEEIKTIMSKDIYWCTLGIPHLKMLNKYIKSIQDPIKYKVVQELLVDLFLPKRGFRELYELGLQRLDVSMLDFICQGIDDECLETNWNYSVLKKLLELFLWLKDPKRSIDLMNIRIDITLNQHIPLVENFFGSSIQSIVDAENIFEKLKMILIEKTNVEIFNNSLFKDEVEKLDPGCYGTVDQKIYLWNEFQKYCFNTYQDSDSHEFMITWEMINNEVYADGLLKHIENSFSENSSGLTGQKFRAILDLIDQRSKGTENNNPLLIALLKESVLWALQMDKTQLSKELCCVGMEVFNKLFQDSPKVWSRILLEIGEKDWAHSTKIRICFALGSLRESLGADVATTLRRWAKESDDENVSGIILRQSELFQRANYNKHHHKKPNLRVQECQTEILKAQNGMYKALIKNSNMY
jgi:hypothetical protein